MEMILMSIDVHEDHVVNILGHIFRKVQWGKMGRRSPYDIFEHRLEYAKYEIGIPEFIQKICDKLSIQAPVYGDSMNDFLQSVEYCRANETNTFKIIRSRGKLLTLLAAKRSKEIISEKNEQLDNVEKSEHEVLL